MKRIYESPKMFAETFIANQYVAACKEPTADVPVTQVKCESKGHQNTQTAMMFLDSNTACVVKFVGNVGEVAGTKFKTQFNACKTKVGCNQQNWQDVHYWGWPKKYHPSEFINHDTTIDLTLAQTYNLS